MARRTDAEPIYQAAAQWTQHCVLRDGSILSPKLHLWTIENLQHLRATLMENPVLGSDSFDLKLARQLEGQRPEVVQLAAEMLWVLFLFPRKMLSVERKRELVAQVWSWSGGAIDSQNRFLGPSVLAGIGNAGTAYNTQRDRELEALIDLVIALKTDAPARPVDSPWRIAEIFDSMKRVARRNIRHVLLHILFPDEFERIASLTRKRKILHAFSDLLDGSDSYTPTNPVQVDRQLFVIRRKLEEQFPEREIDFHDPDLRARWDLPEEPKVAEVSPHGLERPPPAKLAGIVALPNVHAGAGLSLGQQLARRAQHAEPTPDLVFAAYLMLVGHSRYESYSALAIYRHMADFVSDKLGFDDKPWHLLLSRYGVKPPPVGVLVPVEAPGPRVSRILVAADAIRAKVLTGVHSQVSARHVLAVLLLPGPDSAASVLEEHGFDPADLRREMFSSLSTRHLGEDLDAWRGILMVAEPSAGIPEEAIYAGFSTDALPVAGPHALTREDDQLGVMKDVTALCEVLAARKTMAPLAVGLFGDWGTGKSFFMELMRKEIDYLGEQNPSFYCERVVQVWFNAWHYMDTNLWASLAARVFEELAEQPKKWGIGDEVQKNLFEKLQESSGVLAEAVEEKKHAEARITAIKAERAAKGQSLSSTATTAFRVAVAALSADREVQDRLREAKAQLGLSAAQVQVEKVGEQAQELRSLGHRLLVIGRTLLREPRFLVLGLLIFGVVTGIAHWAIQHFNLLRGPSRWLVGGAAWLAGLTAALAPAAARVSRAIRWLEDVSTRLQQQRDAEQRQEDLAIERELTRLDEAERQAQARIDELSREIEELRAGRRLHRFILERHTSVEYRQHLGIVNLIRNDFDQLSRLLLETADERSEVVDTASELLHGKAKSAKTLPKIDRIILYIDDLDRCPEDRVVQVLQAVHLLLAFPLFIVVVGVDSRWLLLSLEDHYAALRGRDREPRQRGPRGQDEWSTTPQNYLEKIFQIPFTLRPMESTGFNSLVKIR